MRHGIWLLWITLVLGAASCRQSGKSAAVRFTSGGDSTQVNCLVQSPVKEFEMRVSNPTTQPLQFSISPGNLNFFNNESLVASVIDSSMSDAEKAMQLWRLLSYYRRHCREGSRHTQSQHNPAVLLNAFGCGLCDDAAAALANLARLAGLKARVVTLTGHVVAEVYYGGSWHMFDAHNRVYFANREGEVYSLQQLQSNPQLISRVPGFLSGLKRSFLRAKIASATNNTESDWYVLTDSSYTNRVTLPPGGKISFASHESFSLVEWLNADTVPVYANAGRCQYTQPIAADNPVFKTVFPYAVNSVAVGVKAKTPCKIFYSPNGSQWFFKGETNGGLNKVVITGFDEYNTPFTFGGYIRVEGLPPHSVAELKVDARFLFSEKVLFNNPTHQFRFISNQGSDIRSLNVTVSTR